MFITLPSSYLLDYENGEDVYEDYELSSDNQTVNQTNGAGLQNNQVSLGSLKYFNIIRKLNDYFMDLLVKGKENFSTFIH